MDHHSNQSLTRTAVSATLHCLLGCSIGEVLGMAIGTAYGFSNFVTIVVSIALAFVFGYGLTLMSLLRSGVSPSQAFKTVLASDTISIISMEITDNLVVVIIPGALDASLTSALFWLSLAASLVAAFVVTVPVNRYLLSIGKGHAHVHK